MIQKSKSSDDKAFDFRVTITPRNEARWKQRIEEVYKALLAADYKTTRGLLDELALMPEEYALPTWRKVLFDKTTEQYYFADRLGRDPSRGKAELLLSLQFSDPIRDPNGRIGSLIPLLRVMAQTGGEDLKGYITKELSNKRSSPFYVAE